MSAKLSSTLASMALLQFPFLLLVLGPLLSKWLIPRAPFEDASSALNKRRGHWLQKDTFWRRLNDGFRPILDLELLAQPCRDDDLALGGEPNGICPRRRTHKCKSDIT